jgi:hypothetical protein
MSPPSEHGLSEGYADAVAAWTAHLRDGGTTTWSTWCSADRPAGSPHPAQPRRPVPDTAHLELVRRLNERAGEPLPGLVDLVLATASPGRGRVDVPLPWPGADRPVFGNPPIDPQSLPEEELVRLAVGVLARLLPDLPAPPPPPDLVRWPMPWRRRFRLHGSPGSVAAVRAALLAQGMVETDWRPVHLVLGRPLDAMMAEHWAATTVAGGHLRWTTLWRRAGLVDALPARIDVVGIAERLGRAVDRNGAPVHLVVGSEAEDLAHAVAGVVKARPFELAPAVDPARVDLLRRLNRLTALTRGPGQVRRLAATLDELLEGAEPRGPRARVPRAVLDWARRNAESSLARVREEQERTPSAPRYAVHGDPGVLVPPHLGHKAGSAGTIDPRHTLEVAVEGCLRAWRRRELMT